MAGVNKVILIGNLGSDPEVRYLEGGRVVANFNIATSESYTNKNGERVEQTEWHRIEIWDGLAKIAEQYLKKGNQVYIEGKLRTDTWLDKESNQQRSRVSIRTTSMTLLGSPNNDNSINRADRPAPVKVNEPLSPTLTSNLEDDLPF